MKNKIIMNKVCIIFIGMNINIKLKYTKNPIKQTTV